MMFNTYNNFDSFRIANALDEKNRIERLKLDNRINSDKRNEWLSRLQRMSDDALLKLLNTTEEFEEFPVGVRCGVGMAFAGTPIIEKVKNNDYIDIKNECIIRGLSREGECNNVKL